MIEVITALTARLQAASIGTFGTNLFANYFPDSPDAMVAVMDGPGTAPTYTATGIKIRHATVQVFARGVPTAQGYVDAQQKAEAVHRSLNFANTTVANIRFLDCHPVDEPHMVEKDENDRPTYSVNFELSYEAPTGSVSPFNITSPLPTP